MSGKDLPTALSCWPGYLRSHFSSSRKECQQCNDEPKKLLDQVREAIRVKHYSIRTEEAYINWVKRYVLFHKKRHPRTMVALHDTVVMQISLRRALKRPAKRDESLLKQLNTVFEPVQNPIRFN